MVGVGSCGLAILASAVVVTVMSVLEGGQGVVDGADEVGLTGGLMVVDADSLTHIR